jgi:large subunit ribosomal protein L22
MEVRAETKYVRISAFKAREVTREIQGLPAAEALDVLRFSPKKAAIIVSKTLKSALANAEHNKQLKPGSLTVKEAVVGEGPTLKRSQPKARGSAGPILKRTSHVRVILTDEPRPEKVSRRDIRQGKGRKASGKTAPEITDAEVVSETVKE